MLDFQVSTIVFTVINLLVLYFILRKLLFGRVNAVLEQRAARVKETIDSAEASKCQAEELRAEYEDKLTDARQEAAKLVADAQNRAQRAYEAKMADAETDAKRLRSEAEAQIASERDAMLRGRLYAHISQRFRLNGHGISGYAIRYGPESAYHSAKCILSP